MITPTVLASSVCVTSTTVCEKFGSLSEGLATSSRPLGGSSCCASAGAAGSQREQETAARSMLLGFTGTLCRRRLGHAFVEACNRQ